MRVVSVHLSVFLYLLVPSRKSRAKVICLLSDRLQAVVLVFVLGLIKLSLILESIFDIKNKFVAKNVTKCQ